MSKKLVFVCVFGLLPACTFNFELTSQRTALENQVMGSYREIEDDLVLISSVRGETRPAKTVSTRQKNALDARQNQEFNQDDVDELKVMALLGEANDGQLMLLPQKIGLSAAAANKKAMALAASLVVEENRDRVVIWQRIIELNENLSAKDLPNVRKTYAKMQRETAVSGHWYEDEVGHWVQKSVTNQKEVETP